MDNTIKIVNSHSKYVASKKDQANQNLCNCRNSDNCPLDNKYSTSKIVCSTERTSNNQQPSKVYLGICKTEFKTRFNNHIGRMKRYRTLQVHLGVERQTHGISD